MAVVHPRECSNVMVLDRFPFSRLDFCFFGAKKKNWRQPGTGHV